MKKFFNIFAIAVVAMATVGCNNNDDDEILGLDIDTVQSAISQTIDKFGDYDVNLVSEALTGKSWEIWSDIVYYEDWSGIRYICYYEGQFPTPPIPGWSKNRDYEFLDGNRYKKTFHEYTVEGRWEFNTEERTITFYEEIRTYANGEVEETQGNYSCTLLTLSENTFMLQGESSREEYKVKE